MGLKIKTIHTKDGSFSFSNKVGPNMYIKEDVFEREAAMLQAKADAGEIGISTIEGLDSEGKIITGIGPQQFNLLKNVSVYEVEKNKMKPINSDFVEGDEVSLIDPDGKGYQGTVKEVKPDGTAIINSIKPVD